MKTPFLDQLINEHQNHIESVEASSYAGIPETRKQLAELEAIKAIIVTHCCKSDSELLKGKHPMTFSKWRESEGYTPYDNTSYQKDNKIFNVDKLEIKYRAYYKTF
jgi:hypothetical protein